MKFTLPLFLSGICMLQVNSQFASVEKPAVDVTHFLGIEKNDEALTIKFQSQPGDGKMRSIVFKSQEYCRVEIPDFEFEARFSIVSANIYFSGTNFRNVERGALTSSSLKPVKDLMARCAPGTIVAFDDIKVIGPDKQLRTIQGLSLLLY